MRKNTLKIYHLKKYRGKSAHSFHIDFKIFFCKKVLIPFITNTMNMIIRTQSLASGQALRSGTPSLSLNKNVVITFEPRMEPAFDSVDRIDKRILQYQKVHLLQWQMYILFLN